MDNTKKKKICMLAARHSPFDARIFHKEAMTLKNADYEITIVAPFEKKILDSSEIKIEGFKKKKGPLRKVNTIIKLISLGIKTRANIYHCHEVDASFLAGILIKKILKWKKINVKLIYDSHEHWPASWSQMVSSFYLKKIIYSMVSCWEKWAMKHCDAVFTANKIVKKHLESLNKNIKIEVLYNCPILTSSSSSSKNDSQSCHMIICHEGSLSFKRGLKEMIESLKRIRDKINNNIKLLIVGDIFAQKEKKWLNEKIIEYKLKKNIEFTGWLPYHEIGDKIQKCNVGLILFKPTLNNKLAGPPNKLFNYMQYGLPIIAPSFCFETKNIIDETNCGILIQSITTENVYNAVKNLLNDHKKNKKMGENGRKAVLEKYNWENEGKKLLKIYKSL